MITTSTYSTVIFDKKETKATSELYDVKEKVCTFDQIPPNYNPLLGTVGLYTVYLLNKLYTLPAIHTFYKIHRLVKKMSEFEINKCNIENV